jgi:Flp pilus assembly protein TadB
MHDATTAQRRSDTAQRSNRAEKDPEGRPAHPEYGTRTISVLLLSVIVALFVAALVLAIFTTWQFAVAVGALALLLYLVNPVVWAAILRTQDSAHSEGRERR